MATRKKRNKRKPAEKKAAEKKVEKVDKVALEKGSSLPPTEPSKGNNHDDGRPRVWVLNDIDNAALFADMHENQVKYVGTWKRWFCWNGSVWSEDEHALVQHLAKQTARLIKREAQKSGSRAFMVHGKHSCSRTGVAAMLALAESEGLLRRVAADFDRDPWLLNGKNGTIDLRTGRIREHRREDFITHLADVEYDPDARCRKWDAFLEQMVPDAALRDYLQRAVGYTLTGVTDEQKFFLVFGRGASGKGTFIEAIDGIMGTYATVANFRLFLEGQDKRFEMWRHAYSRMVSAQEVKEGQKFDVGTVKLMVGGDKQTAERKYCDQFAFTPRWTVWLGANSRPHIDGGDDAMWRRVRVIPFNNSLPPEKRDPQVRRVLASDPEAQKRILAWAVEGTRKWLKRPLSVDEPEAVRIAVAQYKDSADNFGGFFAETFEEDPEGFVPWSVIDLKYASYCSRNAETVIGQHEITRHLREMGFVPTRARQNGEQVRGWKGFVARP